MSYRMSLNTSPASRSSIRRVRSVASPHVEHFATGDSPDGSRVIFLQDPDGFFLEVFQPATITETSAPASSNVIGSGFEIMVTDTAETMRVYKEALGFEPQVGTAFDGTRLLMDTAGTPGAQFKRSAARIPGSAVTMAFLGTAYVCAARRRS